MSNIATLQEIEGWSLNKIYDAHEALDIRFEMEEFEAQKAKLKK